MPKGKIQLPRDNRRSRLYTAEAVLRNLRVSRAAAKYLLDTQPVAGYSTRDADGNLRTAKCPTVDAVQQYVDAVTAAAWFQSRWGQRRLMVRAGKGSHASGNHLTVSQPHRWSEAVILHEIAHCLTGIRYAAHGPEFAGVLLTLVKFQMGKPHADALRDAFRSNGVRYTLADVPAPARPVGPSLAQRQAAERRAAKAAETREKAVRGREQAEATRRLTGSAKRQESAASIRLLAKEGFFGPAGSKPRVHALATARLLEKGTR